MNGNRAKQKIDAATYNSSRATFVVQFRGCFIVFQSNRHIRERAQRRPKAFVLTVFTDAAQYFLPDDAHQLRSSVRDKFREAVTKPMVLSAQVRSLAAEG